MKKRNTSLAGLLWTLKNNGVLDICKQVDCLKNNGSAVLMLEKRKFDSDFIVIERTSEKCFRVSGLDSKSSFTKASLAYKYIVDTMIRYFAVMADFNCRVGIDNSSYIEKLNRLKGGATELSTFQK